jgi:hypothetical protein
MFCSSWDKRTYLHQTGDGVSDLVTNCQLFLCHSGTGEDLRGDINQQLLLVFGFLCLDTSLLRLDHSLLLNLFIELTFRDVGLDISRGL